MNSTAQQQQQQHDDDCCSDFASVFRFCAPGNTAPGNTAPGSIANYSSVDFDVDLMEIGSSISRPASPGPGNVHPNLVPAVPVSAVPAVRAVPAVPAVPALPAVTWGGGHDEDMRRSFLTRIRPPMNQHVVYDRECSYLQTSL